MNYPASPVAGGNQSIISALRYLSLEFAVWGTGGMVTPTSGDIRLLYPNQSIPMNVLTMFSQPRTVPGTVYAHAVYPNVANVATVTIVSGIGTPSVVVDTDLPFLAYQVVPGSNNLPAVMSDRRIGNNPGTYFITASVISGGVNRWTISRFDGANITSGNLVNGDKFYLMSPGVFGEFSNYGAPITFYPDTVNLNMVQIMRNFAADDQSLSALSTYGLGEGALQQSYTQFASQFALQVEQFQIDEDFFCMFGQQTPAGAAIPAFNGLVPIANAASAPATYVGSFDESFLQRIAVYFASFGITEVLIRGGVDWLSNFQTVGQRYQLSGGNYGPVGDTMTKYGQTFMEYTHAGVRMYLTLAETFSNTDRAPQSTNYATGVNLRSSAFIYAPMNRSTNGQPTITPVYSQEFMSIGQASPDGTIRPIGRPTRRYMIFKPSRYLSPQVSNGSSVTEFAMEGRFGIEVWHPHLLRWSERRG